MKTIAKAKVTAPSNDLRPEYDFDYTKARPNPYAKRLKGVTVMVPLAPDVSAVFKDAKSVNTALRGLIKTISAIKPLK